MNSSNLRVAVLSFVTLLILFMGLSPYVLDRPVILGYETVCPFGGLQGLISLLTPKTSSKYAWSLALVALSVIALAIAAGRAFCGHICPMGAVQDFFHWIYNRLGGKKIRIPAQIDSKLRWIKYAIFAGFFSASLWMGTCIFKKVDPFSAMNDFLSAGIVSRLPYAFVALFLTIIFAALFDRAFCKYFCPMGPILAPFNRLSAVTIEKSKSACNSCGACSRACPMNIDVASLDSPQNAECISCDACVSACKNSALHMKLRWYDKFRKVPSFVSITIVVFFASIVSGTVFGGFTWIPETLAETVAKQSAFKVTMIKTHHTFEEIVNTANVPWPELRDGLKLSDDDYKKSVKKASLHADFTHIKLRNTVTDLMKNEQDLQKSDGGEK